MPELPKPKRVDFWNALKYTMEVCGLEDYSEVSPAFFDALCNDDIYFEADLHIPLRNLSGTNKKNQRVPSSFWRDWGYYAFNRGTLGKAVVSLPNEKSTYNPPFYSNLTIETALVDAWLNNAQSTKVKVSAVPEKAYKQRIEQAASLGITYSRGEDREWAKAEGYSVESVQEMRKVHAPAEWQEAGRRSANNLQKESAKESAG